MVKYDEFVKKHYKDVVGLNSESGKDDLMVGTYAKYIINELDSVAIKISSCGGDVKKIDVEGVVIEVGKFGALHCCNLLDAENIFVVENQDLGYSMIGANGKDGGLYNKVATYIWCGVFGQENMLYGDILLIKSSEFSG